MAEQTPPGTLLLRLPGMQKKNILAEYTVKIEQIFVGVFVGWDGLALSRLTWRMRKIGETAIYQQSNLLVLC